MKTGLIIFSRFGSTRLPGKALLPLAGRPLLGHVIDRTRRVTTEALIVVATSDQPEDDPIAEFASAQDVLVFRGDLQDVAGRALACCRAFGFDRFARICGDRVFLPWELIDRLSALQRDDDLDLATNANPQTFPSGTMTEIVRTSALERAMGMTQDPEDREHITRYFYRRPSQFSIGNIPACEADWESLDLAVDVAEDVRRTEWMLHQLGQEAAGVPLEDIVRLAQRWHREAA